MTAEQFDKVLEERITATRWVLAAKAGEYATKDRLYNFKAAAYEFGGTPGNVLWGYLLKHLISVMDMAKGVRSPDSPTIIREKIGDAINYLILLEALLLEPFTHEPFKEAK